MKRNKQFDNFIMLVWGQGLIFHIAARSHPVQEAWGSQDSVQGSKIKGQVFGSTGVTPVKMLQFCWQWSQNVRLVNTIQIHNSLSYVACFLNMVME